MALTALSTRPANGTDLESDVDMPLYKKFLNTSIAAAGAVTLFLGVPVPAQAQVVGAQTVVPAQTGGGGSAIGYAWVDQATSTGDCYAEVFYSPGPKDDPAFAEGYFDNSEAGWTCTGWLERSTNGGSSWYQVSGSHPLASLSYSEAWTDNYYDGPGYLARACFQFSFAGAAIHCTAAI